jgi:outer membrane protein, adhesin transport system
MKSRILLSISLFVIFCFGSARAEDSLSAKLSQIIQGHPLAQASSIELEATQSKIKSSRGKWFPTISTTAYMGDEHRNKATGTTTDLDPRQLTVSAKQLLWDFGTVNAELDGRHQLKTQAQYKLEAVRQDLLLEGLSAYLNLYRAKEVLRFAKQSEGNIKEQAKLENDRIEQGMGISTDLLQAKTQLAGARARRARAEGSLDEALNNYRKVFVEQPDDLNSVDILVFPSGALPSSLDEVLQAAAKAPHHAGCSGFCGHGREQISPGKK